MKVYIVEDEPIAVDHLVAMIREVLPGSVIMGTADNVRDASLWLSQHQPDLIFMDIQLGDALSFEIFRETVVTAPVIFTTAYDRYAVKAFQANGVAYLLKPISREDLAGAIRKIENLRLHLGQPAVLENLIRQISRPVYRERFMVTAGSKLKSVPVTEVSRFVSEGRYTKIVTRDNHKYLINETLEKLEEILDPGEFFRVNRKYMVSVSAIVSMIPWSKSRIKLELLPESEEDIIVSVERSADFKLWLNR